MTGQQGITEKQNGIISSGRGERQNREGKDMEYRKMEKIGAMPSLLGFGCMRFPTLKDKGIDEAEAERMIGAAYEAGVNYFDTAYTYHEGASEPFIGRVLDKYDRDSYYLATKLPCWMVNSLDDAKRIFEDQRKRLNKDYIDFYLLHSLGRNTWERMVRLGVVEYCEKLQEEGYIRFLGFSFHDEYEVFKEIAGFRKWDFCQIQLNYMDTDEQAGMKGYRLTEKLGIPLVVMEPVKGSSLAAFPADIENVFREVLPEASPASWAIRWVGSLPNVKVILSGMSKMEHVADNVGTCSPFAPLDDTEMRTIAKVVRMLRQRVRNGCTGCRYCMPCPSGVDIPRNFYIWNQYGMYGNANQVRFEWGNDMAEDAKARNCISCGRCEKACPQKIRIREDLASAQAELDEVLRTAR